MSSPGGNARGPASRGSREGDAGSITFAPSPVRSNQGISSPRQRVYVRAASRRPSVGTRQRLRMDQTATGKQWDLPVIFVRSLGEASKLASRSIGVLV